MTDDRFKNNSDRIASNIDGLQDLSLEYQENPLDQFRFGREQVGPNFYRQSEYSADPSKVTLREENERKAAEVLGKQTVRTPVVIPRNPDGPTDFKYIVEKMKEAGLDVSVPLQKRQFATERFDSMVNQGTDRTNGLSLLSHHGGDDGEWLAMIEHGLPTSQTSRTTYTSSLGEHDKYDLMGGPFDNSLAIYDGRGLMSCQPSHNKTNSFSNGHQLFVANPRDALLAVVRN